MLFVAIGIFHFISLQGGINKLDFEEVPAYTPNFGFVMGIIAFSYS
jgi:hypothetical protein